MRCIAVLILSLSLSVPLYGDAVTLSSPVYCELFLKDTPAKIGKISGNLVSYSEDEFTVRQGSKEQTHAWSKVTPGSAFVLRQRLIDKKVAADWLALGTFGWKIGAADQAKSALRTAVRLDAALKADADRVTASPAGEMMQSTAAADDKDADKVEKPKKTAGDGTIVAQPGRKKNDVAPPIKYKTATPEEHAAAIERARKQAAKAEEQLNVKFQTFETDHFIVFTDWDAREFSFLKTNLEDAYSVVSREFDISPKENVFVGKLPVYMWSKYKSFEKYAADMDEFPVSEQTAGYYSGNSEGVGHMSMWKPTEKLTGTSSIEDAKKLWGYVLVHEFTHAFIARYRSNERIPRWMNEGIAEVIAMGQVPMNGHYLTARMMAQQKVDISALFDDERMPSGQFYPVMQTMVELLVNENRKNFIKMIDAIKDGTEPEAALKQFYNVDHEGLAKAWREYASRLAKN